MLAESDFIMTSHLKKIINKKIKTPQNIVGSCCKSYNAEVWFIYIYIYKNIS